MERYDLLFSRMEDLAEKAVKTGCVASRFLTPAEAQSTAMYFKNKGYIKLRLDGGFENAERVRAVFINPDWGICERSRVFGALRISHRPQDMLGHRDILGAIMALGIERDTIGDIVSEEHSATVVCLPELGAYIIENLSKVGRVGVTVTHLSLDELPQRRENLAIKTDTVASLRLDAVLRAAFDLPRAKASELIIVGKVNVDYLPCLQPAKEIQEGTLISVRGLGRAKLIEVGGLSRKDRLFIQIGVYGK